MDAPPADLLPHPKKVTTKRSVGKYTTQLDSPAYDASEEDNDPLTDDTASAGSVDVRRTAPTTTPRSKPVPLTAARRHQLATALSDDGVDSPTYDGDIEVGASKESPNRLAPSPGQSHHHTSSAGSTHISSPTSTTFPSGPSNSHGPTSRIDQPDKNPVFISAPHENGAPPSGTAHPQQVPLVTAALTVEEIQEFVRQAIDGETPRQFKINKPPRDRPVRIYADGVYDLFHFGHALQLRQAKLAFPSVQLLVGVCSDKLVEQHKAKCIMTHAERCEAARHCKWVDEVIPEAPWVLDQAFLDEHKIDYVAHDEDPYVGIGYDDVYGMVKKKGMFVPTRRTEGVSTSELLERVVKMYRARDLDGKLEKIGHPELKAAGSAFDHGQTQKP